MTGRLPDDPSGKDDAEKIRHAFAARVQEIKDGVARLIQPHEHPGSQGAITVALLQLGIERHLDRFPDEKSASDLVQGVLRKVLRARGRA